MHINHWTALLIGHVWLRFQFILFSCASPVARVGHLEFWTHFAHLELYNHRIPRPKRGKFLVIRTFQRNYARISCSFETTVLTSLIFLFSSSSQTDVFGVKPENYFAVLKMTFSNRKNFAVRFAVATGTANRVDGFTFRLVVSSCVYNCYHLPATSPITLWWTDSYRGSWILFLLEMEVYWWS